jgi:hypothetical protein
VPHGVRSWHLRGLRVRPSTPISFLPTNHG